ncbi:hypothetical protein [uncultured Draconibacterium sp.]|uniref:hypothetical protein n=1 Tax=uncultured Draconibacterium sp. TaxID=1573823 RepID=UPI002AA87059|nr:hypothetical protein [uncultured Draconibacterium sp.]
MKILRGTVFGGIAFFFLGWLFWGILLMDFSANNYNQDVYLKNNEMVWWAIILSNLIYALLNTLFLKWGQAKKWIDGLKIGILFGGLYALTTDLGIYSVTNILLNVWAIIIDALAYAIITGILGTIIVLTWGKSD